MKRSAIGRWSLVIGGAVALALAPARALTFGEWCGDNGIAVDPAGDPDGDRIINVMEYALADTNPNRGDDSSVLPRMVFGLRAPGTALPWNDSTVIVYAGEEPPLTGSYYIGLRYKPRADTEGLRWLPQYSWFSANMRAWLDGQAVFLSPVAHTDGHFIMWMLGMFRADAPPDRAFARMRVTLD
jgi:hypothetical protein